MLTPKYPVSLMLYRSASAMPILILLLVICAMTAGCAKQRVRTDLCSGWKPIYPSADDVLTDGTAKQILAHDRQGVDVGCWKAPTKSKTTSR